MLVLGLTGSIAAGKSTTAGFFADAGCPVFSADAAVHALYRGPAAPMIEAAFPGTARDGIIDLRRLSDAVVARPDDLRRLESIIHPLVRRERTVFLSRALARGPRLAVIEIPLLFETGAEREVDAIVLVAAPPDLSRQRALARPGMTEAKLVTLLQRLHPEAEKRRRAHFLVDTGRGLGFARRAVGDILKALSAPAAAL